MPRERVKTKRAGDPAGQQSERAGGQAGPRKRLGVGAAGLVRAHGHGHSLGHMRPRNTPHARARHPGTLVGQAVVRTSAARCSNLACVLGVRGETLLWDADSGSPSLNASIDASLDTLDTACFRGLLRGLLPLLPARLRGLLGLFRPVMSMVTLLSALLTCAVVRFAFVALVNMFGKWSRRTREGHYRLPGWA